jgi:hypothetical protein
MTMDPIAPDQSLVDELRWIDSELTRLDGARAALFRRRSELLVALRAAPALPRAPLPAFPSAPSRRPRPELTGRVVARLLLLAGAVLVIIAAAAFTVANWSNIGPLGRVCVLLGVSGLALAAPVMLGRRGLAATAEAVAGVGLALTIGDAYLVGQLLGADSGPLLPAIGAGAAVLAAIWLSYGRAASLRVPVFAAIGMAQLPGVLLTAWLASHAVAPIAFSLAATAGADLLVAKYAQRHDHRAEAVVLSLVGALAWLAGVTLALARAETVSSVPSGYWLAGTFVVAAAAGIVLWPRAVMSAGSVGPVAAASGFLLTGLALPAARALPAGWQVVAFAAAGFAVAGCALALCRWRSWLAQTGLRLDLVAVGAVAVLGMSILVVMPAALFKVGAEAGWPAFLVLALAALACWLTPAAVPSAPWLATVARCAGIAVTALAVAALPAAADADAWARVAVLTAGTAALAAWAARRPQDAGQALVATAAITAAALGLDAALWSVTAMTVPQVALLAAVFAVAAIPARNDIMAGAASGVALAAAAGLPFAAGLPASQAAFATIGVAVTAIVVATLLRRGRPVQSLVLDLGAGPVVVIAAIAAIGRADLFSGVAVTAALLASTASWLRAGTRRAVALWATSCAVVAAVGAQSRTLATDWSASPPWHGHPLVGAGPGSGLPFAVGVLALSLGAIVTAAGALRGSGRGSLDAVAIALPVVAGPALLAGGVSYGLALSCLLVLALGLTVWAVTDGLAPAGGAVAATALAVAWALAAPVPTLVVLGCLTTAYLVCARRFRRLAPACASVPAVAALATAALLDAGLPVWASGLAVTGVGAAAVLAARRVSGDLSLAVATAGWLTAAAGLVFFESAWCVWLSERGVTAIEPYTLPAAAAVIGAGWLVLRYWLVSWMSYGPGLALLLVPSLVATWQGQGWIRPAALGVGAAAITLLGARERLQAPLLIGAIVAATDAGYQLAPAVRRLTEALPGWVPIAVMGTVLLWAGATYEARLRNLVGLRRALAGFR